MKAENIIGILMIASFIAFALSAYFQENPEKSTEIQSVEISEKLRQQGRERVKNNK